MARQWILNSQEGFEKSLEYQPNVPVPPSDELDADEVLVKLHAASLNYRELIIAGPMGINGPITPPIVPGCDGAGIVEAVGSSVAEFKPGDRVITFVAPKLAEAEGDDASASVSDALTALGQGIDGTLRSRGIFAEKALVHAPANLDFLEASTLCCTWLTAWNALFGAKGKELAPGSWVLVQGTGGVSMATLQLAITAGATVVATTSSDEKTTRLKALGAAHVVNYRTHPDNWGQEARVLTPSGRGFDIVVDIGGDETLPQSLAAVRNDGIVMVTGGVGGKAEPVPLFSVLLHNCFVRGVLCGSRKQLKDVVRFVESKGIRPALDDVVFELEEVKDAYRRLKEKRHFSKVVIRINHPEQTVPGLGRPGNRYDRLHCHPGPIDLIQGERDSMEVFVISQDLRVV